MADLNSTIVRGKLRVTEDEVVSGDVSAATFAGSGANLTNLNASNIGSGTLALARIPTGTDNTKVALGGHKHTLTLATDSGSATVNLAHNTIYKLTAGGNSVIFKTPAIDTDQNTSHSHSAGVGLVGSGSAGISGGTYDYKVALVNETLNSAAATKSTSTSGGLYAVEADKDGKLAVRVPWVNSNDNYYHSTGSWNGLTYTAAKNGGNSCPDLAFTIPTGTTSTTVAKGDHLYHYWTDNAYYIDSYSGTKNFRIVTENVLADILRWQAGTIANKEYWDYENSVWVGSTVDFSNLFDGNYGSGVDISNAQRKFRFTMTAASGWPTNCLVCLEGSWYDSGTISTIDGTNPAAKAVVTIETRSADTDAWTTKVTANFTGDCMNKHALSVPSALHTGHTKYRITVELGAWTKTTKYASLRRLMILSNYAGNTLTPFTYNGTGKVTARNTLSATTLQEGGTSLANKYQAILPTTTTAGKVLKSTSTAGTVTWGDDEHDIVMINSLIRNADYSEIPIITEANLEAIDNITTLNSVFGTNVGASGGPLYLFAYVYNGETWSPNDQVTLYYGDLYLIKALQNNTAIDIDFDDAILVDSSKIYVYEPHQAPAYRIPASGLTSGHQGDTSTAMISNPALEFPAKKSVSLSSEDSSASGRVAYVSAASFTDGVLTLVTKYMTAELE